MKLVDDETRSILKALQVLPNIGPACARDLVALGYRAPSDLAGQDPKQMYDRLCQQTGVRHDPCVLDTFMSAVSYANGNPSQKWWDFTAERKQKFPNL